jgi:hypothetical protein
MSDIDPASTADARIGRVAEDGSAETEPFPAITGDEMPAGSEIATETIPAQNRARRDSTASSVAGRFRSASKKFNESSIPSGMWDATGSIASSLPSMTDIRRGSYGSQGWSEEGQAQERERRASDRRASSQSGSENMRRQSLGTPKRSRGGGTGIVDQGSLPEALDEAQPGLAPIPSGIPANPNPGGASPLLHAQQRSSSDTGIPPATEKTPVEARTTPFDNGYQFPPKHKWTESTAIGLKAFWGFFLTPLGFLVTIYGLNVVAWGGMLFLLLCNASPAMCKPDCNNINSPRRKWIEVDSQILNALFCVTGFGLIPWRFRDLYHLLNYRIFKNPDGLSRLAGIHRGWFRLEGSQSLPVTLGPENIEELGSVSRSSIPYPPKSIPDAPLTGIRAQPTKLWKLDFVIWAYVWNTFLQAVLSGFMWGLNRYNRPSWSTGLFVALACIIAAAGGIMVFVEGKKVKSVEGVPVSEKDKKRLEHDRELGITHYNNIKDEKPKEKKDKHKSNDGSDGGTDKANEALVGNTGRDNLAP